MPGVAWLRCTATRERGTKLKELPFARRQGRLQNQEKRECAMFHRRTVLAVLATASSSSTFAQSLSGRTTTGPTANSSERQHMQQTMARFPLARGRDLASPMSSGFEYRRPIIGGVCEAVVSQCRPLGRGAQASPPVSRKPRTFNRNVLFSRLSIPLAPPCVPFSNHIRLFRSFQRIASPPPGAWAFRPSRWEA